MFDIVDEPIDILVANLKRETEKRLAGMQEDWQKTAGYVRSISKQNEEMLIPVTKKIFPNLLAHETVGVQTASYVKNYCYEIRTKDGKFNLMLRNRNLAARWEFECIENAFQKCGIDITDEVHENLANEITAEIDYDLLCTLKYLATDSTKMKYTGKEPSCVGDENPALGILIARQANLIGARLKRGIGNWCIVNKRAFDILTNEYQTNKSRFHPICRPNHAHAKTSLNLVGVIMMQHKPIKVFLDIYANDDAPVLVGCKFDEADAALIYVPYEIIKSSGVIIDPQTFEPIMSFRTCFGMYAANVGKNAKDYLGLIDLPDTKDLVFI